MPRRLMGTALLAMAVYLVFGFRAGIIGLAMMLLVAFAFWI